MKTINLVQPNTLTGYSKWYVTLNKKQQKLVDWLMKQETVKNTIKDTTTLKTMVNKLITMDVDKMYSIEYVSDTDKIVMIKEYLDEEENEWGTTIGIKKLVKLTDELVLLYTNNKINVKGPVVPICCNGIWYMPGVSGPYIN